MKQCGRRLNERWPWWNTWQSCPQPRTSAGSLISKSFQDGGYQDHTFLSVCKWWHLLRDVLVDLSAPYSCGDWPGAGTALTTELWCDAGAQHHAKWSRAGPTTPAKHLCIFSLVCVKSCPPVQTGCTELLCPDPRGALTVIPGKRQIPGEGGCVEWLVTSGCGQSQNVIVGCGLQSSCLRNTLLRQS